MSDGLTDEEFLGYVELHSRTERHLFSKEHAKRLWDLAGRTWTEEWMPAFVGIDAETADRLIARARARKENAVYTYQALRPTLFTEEGQVRLLKVRDNAHRLLAQAGAFRAPRAWEGVGVSDTFELLACLDRLVELGEIRCLNPDARGQDLVYVKA